jgi:hypothetical protein
MKKINPLDPNYIKEQLSKGNHQCSRCSKWKPLHKLWGNGWTIRLAYI